MNGDNLFVFSGSVKKIQITSNNIGYGPCPKADEEVEQRLTINADGRVWFSGYNYNQGFEQYERGRTKNYSIEKETAARILNAVGRYFSGEYDPVFATDIGSWEMTVTNTEGKVFQFKGSLCCDFNVDGVDLSDLIRDTLEMPDLFVFDGNYNPDRVDKITINYHRVTKIKPKVPISETAEYCTWDYSEQLAIDRETETLEHTQHIGSGCVITRKYYVEGGIVGLLDDLDADSLFEHIDGNDPDVITNPLETTDYEITVDFKNRPQLIIKGTYDKNGLPSDFPELAGDILDFMLFYGLGEILDPSVYRKAKRKADDYIFCSVEFNESSKSYYYTTEDETFEIGDDVLVPIGNDGRTTIAEIVNIEYFSEDKVPFPLDRVKSIIGKCTEDELNPPVLDRETSDNKETESIVTSALPFSRIMLCNEEIPHAKINVWAELSEGRLLISGQDFGQAVEDVFGENEYEYFYDFDRENTARLFALLTSEGQNINKMLAEKFGGIDGCRALREFCDENNIKYGFFSC